LFFCDKNHEDNFETRKKTQFLGIYLFIFQSVIVISTKYIDV